MRNSEEAVEKVLAVLRSSEPPPGMERRVMQALQDHASARSRSGWRPSKPLWLVTLARPNATRFLAFGAALASVFAVALAIPAVPWPAHTWSAPKRPENTRPGQTLGHSPSPSVNAAQVGSLPPAASEAVAKRAQLSLPAPALRSMRNPGMRREAPIRESDAIALREMRAPSRPAPPMPLTEQEKLLLRIAHKGDTVDLAMLDPGLTARQEAEGDAEFEKFFGQSTREGTEPERTAVKETGDGR